MKGRPFSGTMTPSTLISIYDAAFSNDHWRNALDMCARSMGANGAMLYELSNLSQVNFALNETNSALHAAADILSEYNQLLADGRGSNYDQEGLGATHRADPFEVVLDTDIWQLDESYQARPEVQLGIRAGFLRRALVNLSDDPNTFRGAIFLYGRQCDAAVPQQAAEVVNLLGPHLSKAVELNRFTVELQRRYDAALAVLDKIDTGILILTEAGEIILKNSVASQVLAEGDGLSVGPDKVVSCFAAEAEAALKDAARCLAGTAVGENDEAGRIIQIARKSSKAALVAVVSPLSDAEMELERNLAGALVTLIDPQKPMKIKSDVVAGAYRLTVAEHRLVDFVLKGLTNKEIALELDVSPETIKSQMKSMFEKCGCRNRVSFVWRVFQFAPPIF